MVPPLAATYCESRLHLIEQMHARFDDRQRLLRRINRASKSTQWARGSLDAIFAQLLRANPTSQQAMVEVYASIS